MSKIRILACAASAIALNACGESGSPAPTPVQAPPPAPPPVMTQPPEDPFPEFVVGNEIRTIDGAKNNDGNPTMGETFTKLVRLAEADYSDGVSSLAGADRKSARVISNEIFAQTTSIPNSFGTSDFLWQWGQFLDHDLDLTDGVLDEGPNGRANDIPVPAGDPFFDPMGAGDKVIEFNRALADPTTGTDPSNPREQMNEITAWIDASNVYGSELDRFEALREGLDSPFLKLEDGLLPLNEDGLSNATGPVADATTLFLAGDVRANEQVGLTVMHTLFVREHNRLAAILQSDFPDLTPNQIFFLARRLVGAEMQLITYNEFLPALLGPNALEEYAGYDALVDASILNEFSAAAYRFGHSALSASLARLDENLDPIPAGPLALRDAFFAAPSVLQAADDLDPFLRGLAMQPHQAIDAKVIDDVRNFLFGPPGAGGFDLASLNIQRGRDHGLASYNDTREALALPRRTSFAEISSDASVQAALAAAYDDVDQVDLWVGGLAEDPLASEGSQVGETFRKILALQFAKLRDGDRLFAGTDMTAYERALISDITLADVIRANTNIGDELQENVFFVPTP